jgi:hypothetical protein
MEESLMLKSRVRFCIAGMAMLTMQTCWANDSGTFIPGTGLSFNAGRYLEIAEIEITATPSFLGYHAGPSALKVTLLGADVTGRINFGNHASHRTLAFGKEDYTIQLDVYKTHDRWTAFGGLGYSALAAPLNAGLKDVFSATMGSAYKIDARSNVGLAYDYRQKSFETGFAQSEVTAFFVHRFKSAWKAQAYVLKGFAPGSPEWGGGASVGYGF